MHPAALATSSAGSLHNKPLNCQFKPNNRLGLTYKFRIYCAGGFNGQECLFTAEFYCPENRIWTQITPMRSRRSGVSIISYNGDVFAVGGFDGTSRLKTSEVSFLPPIAPPVDLKHSRFTIPNRTHGEVCQIW